MAAGALWPRSSGQKSPLMTPALRELSRKWRRVVVEFSKAEFLERAKAESGRYSARSVGEQNGREFLLVWALLEYRDACVQVFTEDGPGAGDGLSRKSVLSEVDAATNRDRYGMP